MERFVHGIHAARRPGKGRTKAVRRLAAALEARPVTGGERGRLVEEEKLRVVPAPNVALTIFEFADADKPVLVLPAAAAERPIVPMHPPAAIAHEPAALGGGVKLAERVDAILQWP